MWGEASSVSQARALSGPLVIFEFLDIAVKDIATTKALGIKAQAETRKYELQLVL